MKALSLWQPWASAIACGVKRIETRSWATTYRGPIAIHAAKKWDADLRDTAVRLCAENLDLAMAFAKAGIKTSGALPLGAVVCIADLVACTTTVDLIMRGINPVEHSLGNYTPGRWGWELANIVRFSEPISARGYQQLWDWDFKPSLPPPLPPPLRPSVRNP